MLATSEASGSPARRSPLPPPLHLFWDGGNKQGSLVLSISQRACPPPACSVMDPLLPPGQPAEPGLGRATAAPAPADSPALRSSCCSLQPSRIRSSPLTLHQAFCCTPPTWNRLPLPGTEPPAASLRNPVLGCCPTYQSPASNLGQTLPPAPSTRRWTKSPLALGLNKGSSAQGLGLWGSCCPRCLCLAEAHSRHTRASRNVSWRRARRGPESWPCLAQPGGGRPRSLFHLPWARLGSAFVWSHLRRGSKEVDPD